MQINLIYLKFISINLALDFNSKYQLDPEKRTPSDNLKSNAKVDLEDDVSYFLQDVQEYDRKDDLKDILHDLIDLKYDHNMIFNMSLKSIYKMILKLILQEVNK